jgi:uncharacterized membrane protein YccC
VIWSDLVDLLFPPDPGALRLLAALRATLAAVLAFVAVIVLSQFIDIPPSDRILAFAVALFIAANVRDPTPRARLTTIAIAPFVSFASTVVATFLLPWPFVAAAIVPPLMFAIVYAATQGPRYASLGVVGLIVYFIGLVARQPPETLPMRFVVLLIAAATVVLIRGVLMRERPQAELDRLRRAIHASVDRVLHQIASAVDTGAWTDATRGALRRDVSRLGEAVMLAQARVAALGPQVPEQGSHWLHLLTIELATERVARASLQDLGGASDRVELHALLRAVNDGTTPVRQSKAPLAISLALLARVMREVPSTDTPQAAAAPAPATSMPGLRSAFQTAIAAALAITSGAIVSPARWYWAAFAAYVMFQGTRSRGESIAKGIQFMVGTVAGVAIGALLATLLSGHDLLTLAMIIVAVFLAFQANLAAYGVMVFWITIILGLTFGMFGYFAPEFLLLRLQETAAGAICGALVASFVLVRREYAATYDATIAFLRALGESVDSAARVLLDHASEPRLTALILAAEQRFRDLSAVAQSEQSSHPVSRDENLRRRVLVLEACEAWERELGQLCLESIRLHDQALIASVRQTVARIDASVASLIEALVRHQAIVPSGREATEDLAPFSGDDPAQQAVRLLLRIDSALLLLAARQ